MATPTCCATGEKLGVRVCPECDAASRAYSWDSGVGADWPILSIRQPWAWLIIHAGKDIENRSWPTRYRGRFWVHASKGMTRDEWESAWIHAHGTGASPKAVEAGLNRDNIQRGGIVGSVEIVDCVTDSTSHWFVGRYGFVLRNPQVLPFTPLRGQLGFFRRPE